MPAFVITATPILQKSALAELQGIDIGFDKVADLKNGVFLAETQMPAPEFIDALVEIDPVFVRHIMPVQADIDLSSRRLVDLPHIVGSLAGVCDVTVGDRFCVQCRRADTDYDYNVKDVEVFVGSHFEAKGAIPEFSDTRVEVNDDKKVIGIYLFLKKGYLGCSTVRESLNEHCDEYRVFSRHGKSISRAEAKLREAIRKFSLVVPRGRALDLGAAPGGWTKVLVDSGMQVTAVDPGELDEQLAGSPGVTHVKARAENYVGEGEFDLLVNDMNMDPDASAGIMVKLAPYLKPGAFALMTAKLVVRKPNRLLSEMRPVLEEAYHVLRMKNLFHNRQEVTVLLRRLDTLAPVGTRRKP